jgi:DNA-binding MurR/RpiR family transcriptional regulator
MAEAGQDIGKRGAGQDVIRRIINEKAISLPPQQRKVAELLVKNPDKIVFGTLRSVADWGGVSTLTVLRFAKALGFKGYHALQAAARAAYLPPDGTKEHAQHTNAVAHILAEQMAEVREVGSRIKPEEIEDVCRSLATARRVYICSTEPAAALARVLARRLLYAGISNEILAPADVLTTFSHRGPHKKDVFIGVHLWLLFLDVYRVIEFAKSNGAKTIVFAGSPISPLWQLSDHYLYAHVETGRAYSSWIPLMALFEIVTARLIERNPAPSKGIYDAFQEQARREISTVDTLIAKSAKKSKR